MLFCIVCGRDWEIGKFVLLDINVRDFVVELLIIGDDYDGCDGKGWRCVLNLVLCFGYGGGGVFLNLVMSNFDVEKLLVFLVLWRVE